VLPRKATLLLQPRGGDFDMVGNDRFLAFAHVALLVALASALCGAPARCETASLDKRAEIKEILIKTNAVDTAKRGMGAMAPMLLQIIRAKHSEMTAEQAQATMDIIKGVMNDQAGFVEKTVTDAYDETFSTEEVDALYKFYASPIGAQIASKVSAAQENAALKGQAWGQSVFGPEVIKRLKANESLKNFAD
jgi:hypothetical protein